MNCHSLPKKIILILLVLLLGTSFVFASEEDAPSSEVSSFELVIPEEYKDPVYDKLASDPGASKAQKTIDDIYQQLASVLSYQYYTNLGENYNSIYSLPKIASYTDRIAQILYGSGQAVPTTSLYSRVTSLYNAVNELHFILNGDYTGSVFVRPDIQSALFSTDGQGNFTTISDILYEYQPLIYSMLAQVHGDGQNNSSYLSSISSNVSAISNSLFDTHKINWSAVSSGYFGASQTAGGSYVNSGWYSDLYFSFNLPASNSSSPQCFRFYLPITASGTNNSHVPAYIASLKIWVNNNLLTTSGDITYYVEPTSNGTYLYLFGFNRVYTNGTYFLEIKTSDNSTYYYTSTNSLTVSSVDFDTYDYQLLKSAFTDQQVSNDLRSIADYLVDPDKKAAEAASQAVIDDTLDGFTGNGSAAAKTSDTGSMKNASSGLRQGLDTGAGVSNAMSVFTNSNFWGWFTQSNSNQINNTYPAPDVNSLFNSRAPGDYIPDFLSNNENQLHDLLGGSEW